MAPKQPYAKYQYVVTPEGPKLMPADEPHCKDEESPADYNAGGYLPVKVGDYFNDNRYRVVRKLGWGHFSTVWLVKDARNNRHSALKVVKSAGRYTETARDEIKLLSRVSSFSPTHPGKEHIVSFLDSFSHQGPEASHICIVFEPLGENLLALIERNKKKGVPRPLVKVIAKQILLGLQYLHDECDLVHTDIKPENICEAKVSPENEVVRPTQAPAVVPNKPKATTDLETQLSSVISSSWKATTTAISNSWKDKISASIASNKSHSSPNKTSNLRPAVGAHTRSHSGLSNPGFWKDPGTSALAPAILVSAVVSTSGHDDDFFKLSTVEGTNSTSSEASSTTATVRPSPNGTPLPTASKKSASLISDVGKLINETSSYFAGEPSPTSRNDSSTHDHTRDNASNPINQHLSLLTQTAPSRPDSISNVSPSKRTITRVSPPQQVSQLSAHMHLHKPVSNSHSDGQTKSRSSRRTELPSITSVVPIPSASVTPTPASATPPAPPPTPVDSSPLATLVPPAVDAATTNITHDKPVPPPISIKIADLGNATPSTKHYTDDIQTRQYRAPEAILGRRDWDARADIWSVACVLFELLTAEYLFDPQSQGELFSKDDDHMAQIIELLGDFALEVKMGGKYSRELFDHTGALRYIRTLKPWPLKRVMIEKYLFSEADATVLCGFLEPMLATDMHNRAHARDLKDHKWLEITKEDGVVTEW
ncbi:CMGC/SRPK protein kinase [Pholiota molesta]|nr:CMGC/SRPK protein kinase [Pholiota molesta]